MSVTRLALAWLLAVVALVVGGGADPTDPLTAVHPTALVGLALAFVVGVPSTAPAGGGAALPLALAALLPPLALAAAIDAGRGEPHPAWALALACAALAAAAAWTSRRAAGSPAARAVYGVYFWGVVCGLPLLGAALAWGGRPGEGAVPLAAARGWSPLGFAFDAAAEGALPAPRDLPWRAPLALALAAAAAVEVARRFAGARRGATVALVAVAAVAGADRAAASDARLFPAEVECVGPLDSLAVDAGRAGTATLRLDLAAGERRSFTLPLPILNATARELGAPPSVAASGGGTARFVRWVEDDPALAAWARVPLGLGSRPWPAPEARAASWAWGGLALVLAAFVVALGARRGGAGRVGLALAVQLGAVALFWAAPQVGVRAPSSGAVTVVDLDLDAGRAATATAARDQLALGRGPWSARVETEPAGVRLDVRLALVEGAVEASVVARGAVLIARAPAEPRAVAPSLGPAPIGPDGVEALGRRLAAGPGPLWVRRADGTWLPPAGPPPAWAAAGLPPGVPGAVARDGADGPWRRISGRALGALDLAPRGL